MSSELIRVDCEHCGEVFQAADTMAGGMTNCPRCNKATTVSGLGMFVRQAARQFELWTGTPAPELSEAELHDLVGIDTGELP